MSSRHFVGKLADPEFRKRRAAKAAKARTGADHHITKLTDVAGDLTDEQARRLVGILGLWARPASDEQPLDAA